MKNDDMMEITLPGPRITARVSMGQVRQALVAHGFVLTADTTFGEERWDPPGGDGSDWTILHTGPTAPSVMGASLGFAVSALSKLDGCSPGEMLARLASTGAGDPPTDDEPNRYRVERAGDGWVRLRRPPLTLDRSAGISRGMAGDPEQLRNVDDEVEFERLRRLAGLDAEGNRIETGYTRSQLCAGADAAHEALHEISEDDERRLKDLLDFLKEWTSSTAGLVQIQALEQAVLALFKAHVALHRIGCGLPRVGCATPDPEAQAILADLSAAREREIPCGHTVADLIGGEGSVTKCGACLALIQPGTKRRDAFVEAIRALTADSPDGETIAWVENGPTDALRAAAEAYFGISFRADSSKVMERAFYLVSTLPHIDEDKVLLWCPKAMGYTCVVDRAGRYTASKAAPHLSKNTFAVPCAMVEAMVLRIVDIVHLDVLRAASTASERAMMMADGTMVASPAAPPEAAR